jgi:hypothetical protein
MELEKMLITDGYIGRMGKTWKTPTEADLEAAIVGAMEINDMSREQVVQALESGKALNWRKSPNYYYDHSYGQIGRKREPKPVRLVHCDCGHDVPPEERMMASLGTSCPNCYDSMSN